MKFDKVVIKQIPDDTAMLTGLHKYGRSKMPGTMDSLPATLGSDGRYITGIDENAHAFQFMEDKERKAELQAEIKALREYLQSVSGFPDLSATSPFWETFRVQLSSDSPLTLNRTEPLDVIRYHVLVANGYAAPDHASSANPEYVHCKYYCFIEERAEQEDVSTFRKRDMARSELVKIAESDEYLLTFLQYLVGDKVKKGMKPDTLYRIASEYINDKDADNVKRFLKAAKLGAEELQFKIAIDRAIKRKIIKKNGEYYQRGQVTLGKSLPDVYSNLKKPENAAEFSSIQEELESN